MTKIKNKKVLITGGASGIGKIMGRLVLEKGATSLLIWDINEVNLVSTAAEYASLGRVITRRIDLTDYDEIARAYAETKATEGDVDILINCAGIVTSNHTFDKMTTDEIRRTMEINATAPMVLAKQMLPDMVARNSGHICNIASAAGTLSMPKMSVYAASKWAMVGWSDSVRIELKESKSSVHFTTIAPYFINTGMFDGVKSSLLMPIQSPEKVSRKIIRAIECNKNFKGIPYPLHFIRLMQGLLPTVMFDFLCEKILQIFHTMDNFTGRNNNQTQRT